MDINDSLSRILSRLASEKSKIENIPEFQRGIEAIENCQLPRDCSNSEEYVRKLWQVKDLYNVIKKDGYKTQEQLRSANISDEIVIWVGRKGEFFIESGFTRLVIAQMLNMERIPVYVGRRHESWALLRQDVFRVVADQGFFHQRFNNPDMEEISKRYGIPCRTESGMYGNERWVFMSQNLPFSSGTVLDIGAYFGMFCHSFEDLGFECFAVEMDRFNLNVLKRYRQLMGKNFTVWEGSIFDIERSEFDLVIALNVFHHLVKTKSGYKALIQFLQRLKCKAMFFEVGTNHPEGYKCLSSEDFIALIFQHSVLKKSKKIGRAKEKRDLYLLTT